MYPLLTEVAFNPCAIPARTTIHQPLNILKADLFGDIVFKSHCFAKTYLRWICGRKDPFSDGGHMTYLFGANSEGGPDLGQHEIEALGKPI